MADSGARPIRSSSPSSGKRSLTRGPLTTRNSGSIEGSVPSRGAPLRPTRPPETLLSCVLLYQTHTLLRIYWQPAETMSAILDRGSLLFASLAALVDSFLLGRAGFQFSFYTPLLVLALFYVPGVLALGKHL